MTKSEKEVEDMKAAYQKWAEEYKPVEFVDNWITEEGKTKLDEAGEDHIFTYNMTCGEEIMTPGRHDYSGSCCWQVHGYWITEKPWDKDFTIEMSTSVPCLTCNPKEIEDFEGDPNCEECGGTGFSRYFAED